MGVHRAFELGSQFPQMCEAKRIVLIGMEAGASIVSTLNDMDRQLSGSPR
jgi:hypothetical protein